VIAIAERAADIIAGRAPLAAADPSEVAVAAEADASLGGISFRAAS
jgi:hypothetical protein